MYSETFLASANFSAGPFSPEIDSSASGKHKGGGVPRAGDPDWSLPPNVSEHNSRNRLSAVWPRLAATCNFLELRSQGVANSRGRQPPLSGGRCREPSPRDPQSRGACRGATSLRTRNAAVLPAAQRYGVSARGPVPGGEGKYDRRFLTQQQRQGLLASENGSCFCWKPHYSHRSVEGYRCCFL